MFNKVTYIAWKWKLRWN